MDHQSSPESQQLQPPTNALLGVISPSLIKGMPSSDIGAEKAAFARLTNGSSEESKMLVKLLSRGRLSSTEVRNLASLDGAARNPKSFHLEKPSINLSPAEPKIPASLVSLPASSSSSRRDQQPIDKVGSSRLENHAVMSSSPGPAAAVETAVVEEGTQDETMDVDDGCFLMDTRGAFLICDFAAMRLGVSLPDGQEIGLQDLEVGGDTDVEAFGTDYTDALKSLLSSLAEMHMTARADDADEKTTPKLVRDGSNDRRSESEKEEIEDQPSDESVWDSQSQESCDTDGDCASEASECSPRIKRFKRLEEGRKSVKSDRVLRQRSSKTPTLTALCDAPQRLTRSRAQHREDSGPSTSSSPQVRRTRAKDGSLEPDHDVSPSKLTIVGHVIHRRKRVFKIQLPNRLVLQKEENDVPEALVLQYTKEKKIDWETELGKVIKTQRPRQKRPPAASDSSDQEGDWEPDSHDENGTPQYMIDRIVDKRLRPDGTAEYLVKWCGWGSRYNEWRTAEDMDGNETIELFESQIEKSTTGAQVDTGPVAESVGEIPSVMQTASPRPEVVSGAGPSEPTAAE